MKIPICRAMCPPPSLPPLIPRRGWSMPLHSFTTDIVDEAIENAISDDSKAGDVALDNISRDPWITIDVPGGSRLVEHAAEDNIETLLKLPDGELIDATEALTQFGDPRLARSEAELANLALDSNATDQTLN